MLEPKRKHLTLVIGTGIAVTLGIIKGSTMEATTQSDVMALIIAFIIILGILGISGYFIDQFIYKKQKQNYKLFIAQSQYNYDL